MTDTAESWKWVPDCEGKYAVSDLGRVYSHVSKRFLKPGRMSGGHVSVALGRGNSRCVHELVLTTFVGQRPKGYDARHLNGVHADNRLVNLEWCTRGDNTRDKKWHDGQKNRLTFEQVVEIKSRLSNGDKPRAIAADFGVAPNTIYNIVYGKAHTDV